MDHIRSVRLEPGAIGTRSSRPGTEGIRSYICISTRSYSIGGTRSYRNYPGNRNYFDEAMGWCNLYKFRKNYYYNKIQMYELVKYTVLLGGDLTAQPEIQR